MLPTQHLTKVKMLEHSCYGLINKVFSGPVLMQLSRTLITDIWDQYNYAVNVKILMSNFTIASDGI